MKGQIEIERTFTTMPGDLADTLADTITFADAFALFGYDCSLTKRGNSINQQKGISMLRDLGWSFYSILALICGIATAWLHWWVVMHEGLWPYIIFELIPGLPGVASGVYAIHRDGSKVAWAGVLLSLSPLATWLSI
ncbi:MULTISPECIES: hypothetical protein [Achromobacter]|uniref:hypothetical protein n=1 Tax=Achromobacter TaxID=222 RepID=UPI002102664C|nr:hypothetical protein [Achromobacter sp. ACM05]